MTIIETTNPPYLHPSDGSNSITVEKLEGSINYRSWKRSMEIALASKRKLGFVTGSVPKDDSYKMKQDAWDTCNNMVICWLLGNVVEPIKKSVMFLNTAHQQIWAQLEQRFEITNGSRKYYISKKLYETKQGGKGLNEYYTEMKVMWEEMEMLNTLPAITNVTGEVGAFIKTLNQQKEEQKLFQFLNGLDEINAMQRTQILMMTTLPSVELAYSIILQEESQRAVLREVKEEGEGLAMFSK